MNGTVICRHSRMPRAAILDASWTAVSTARREAWHPGASAAYSNRTTTAVVRRSLLSVADAPKLVLNGNQLSVAFDRAGGGAQHPTPARSRQLLSTTRRPGIGLLLSGGDVRPRLESPATRMGGVFRQHHLRPRSLTATPIVTLSRRVAGSRAVTIWVAHRALSTARCGRGRSRGSFGSRLDSTRTARGLECVRLCRSRLVLQAVRCHSGASRCRRLVLRWRGRWQEACGRPPVSASLLWK